MHDFIKNNKIELRPLASNGFWLMVLLPLAVCVSSYNHTIALTPTYKLASLFSVGLLTASFTIYYQFRCNRKLSAFSVDSLPAFILTAILFETLFAEGWILSTFSSILATFYYQWLYKYTLNKFPKCFTLGEAGVVCQAISYLTYSSVVNIINNNAIKSDMQRSTIIIQIGLLGLILIAAIASKYQLKDRQFFILTAGITIFGILLPGKFFIGSCPIIYAVILIASNFTALKIVLYWAVCVVLAFYFLSIQITANQRATTATRKVFHILAVAIIVPALMYACNVMYLASGVALGVLITLELVRKLQAIPQLTTFLNDGFTVFADEKDQVLALTPLYLWAGCCLPIWLHPAPCDVTDSVTFSILPLISGVLSIGIGDTFASLVGSKLGRFKWHKSTNKTIEGSIACGLSQLVFIYILYRFGFIYGAMNILSFKIIVSVVVVSIVEAFTDQVDNLVLPLIMYTILI